MVPEYSQARKLAQKAYRQDIAAKRNPYLQVLDEILPFVKTSGEMDLGLVEIPLSRIAGTKTSGRTRAFAGNFMPLLPEESEFADKWCSLYLSHLKEGIREPVIACEFMNYYYIIEGNKRISVLKFTGAVSAPAYVTRIIPAPGHTPELKIYYEYMDFYRASGINTIYFTREGSFSRLCWFMGKDLLTPWSEEDRMLFSSAFLRFSQIYKEKGGERLPLQPGDGFLLYLSVYGWESMPDKSMDQLRREIVLLWPDLESMAAGGDVRLITQPAKQKEKSFIKKLILAPRPKLTVGFIYYGTIYTSGWTYAHDLGRLYLEDVMGDRIVTRVYDGIQGDKDGENAVEQAIADGCQVIFTTSVRFLDASIRTSIRHPEIRILNCSLNTYTGHLRTYYGRLYEAKFLVGMLAGILSDCGKIGYIAEVPLGGTAAAVNAFALGVQTVYPGAKVLLEWSSAIDGDAEQKLRDAGAGLISGPEMLAPSHSPRPYGLYLPEGSGGVSLASSIWHWGKFYHQIMQTIMNGNWERDGQGMDGDSINYWWGISSGIIDVIFSKNVPQRSIQLVEMMKRQIINGNFQIFSGGVRSQDGTLQIPDGTSLTPSQIVRMDWLAENVKGRIPSPDEMNEEASRMMKNQGIFPGKDVTL